MADENDPSRARESYDAKGAGDAGSTGRVGSHTKQMTPTATWWFKGNADVMAAVALATKMPSTAAHPALPWAMDSEHWFTISGGLSSALNVSTLELRCHTTGLDADTATLVASWTPRFYGKTTLYGPNVDHWTAGAPPGSPNSNGYYFEASTSISPRPRVYFQLDSNGELESMIWFTDTRFGSFDTKDSPITLDRVTLGSSWPTANYHYPCP